MNIEACTSLTEISLHSTADRNLIKIVERIFSHIPDTVERLNLHVMLRVAMQASRLVAEENDEDYARMQARLVRLRSLRELRFTMRLGELHALQYQKYAECPYTNDEGVCSAIKAKLPELAARGVLYFGAEAEE